MASGSESDDSQIRSLPISKAVEDGCTRWRQFEEAGGQDEAPRAPRCVEAASKAKCACGAVICKRCDYAQEETGDVWRSCEICEKVYACSRCLDQGSDVLKYCEGGCDTRMCEDCRSSCEDCDKLLCNCGDYCYTEVDGNKYCEDCYPKMVARTEEYYEEQRALWSEVHGEDYQPSDEEPRSRSRSRSGSYERQIEFEMRCYGRY